MAPVSDYGGGADSFREYGVNKGLLGACVFEAMNLLEAALAAGPSDAAQDHVDKAWAVFYGSMDKGDNSVAEVTAKREKASDFGAGTTLVWGRQHAPFLAARAALAATGGDAGKAADAVMSIKKGIILTFARATIKYSAKRLLVGGTYSAGAHMEGDAYYRIFAGVALSTFSGDARTAAKTKLDAISAKMSYQQAETALTASTDFCAVKKMLEEMYVDLELDCDMGGERYFYMPLSDVYSYAMITKDVARMTSLAKDALFPDAKTIYVSGENSNLKMQTIATTDHGSDAFFAAYSNTFGSKTSFDDVILPALDGSGDMTSKDDSFKAYVVAKCGITALNMETMTLLNKAKAAPKGANAYDATGTLGAAFLWDAAYATFNGVPDGNSVGGATGGVCYKRDDDFVDATNGAVAVRKMILKQFQAD